MKIGAPTEHELIASALDEMDEGIIVLDDELRLRLWNGRVVELLEMPSHLCQVGRPIADLISYFHRAKGRTADQIGAALAARLRDFRDDHVALLPADHFGGRILERRRRALQAGGMVLTYIDVTDASRREQEVADNRILLSATLTSMDQGILVLDPDLNIRIWNKQVLDLLALPADFVRRGQPMSEILEFVGGRAGRTPEAQRRRTAELLADFRRDRSVALTNLNPAGRTIERRSRPMPDGGVVLTYADVTALTERERTLEDQRRLLAATLANMEQGILVLDDDLNIQAWNERAVRMFSLPDDFLRVGGHGRDLVRYLLIRAGRKPEEAERISASRVEHFRSGELLVLSGPDTAGRILERRSRPMPAGGYVVVYTDVTERRRDESEIAEKSALLSTTLDNMDQGLIVIDGQDRVTLWNDRFVTMFTLPDDLIKFGCRFEEILRYFIDAGPTPKDRVETAIAARLAEMREAPVSIVDRVRPDGVFERRCRVMPDGSCVITYSNVTERRRAEDEINRAREAAEMASSKQDRIHGQYEP